MSVFIILKFVHVVLAIVAVGTNITYGVWLSRAARSPEHLGYVLRGVKILDDRLANPAYGLLLLTGLAMVAVSPFAWTTPWILLSIILYGAVVALAFRGYTPLLRRQIAALEAGDHASPAYQDLATRSQRVGIAIAVLVVIIVFLMVTKPALWG